MFYLKNLTTLPFTSFEDLAYLLEKSVDFSTTLSKKCAYTPGIRSTKIFALHATGEESKSSVIFVDLPDYDKLQPNIIDSQKLYESIVLSNTMKSLAKLLAGFQRREFALDDAPYGLCKLTRVLQALLQVQQSELVNVAFVCCLWPIEAKYADVLNTLKFVDAIKNENETMQRSEYQGEMTTNSDKQLEELLKKNVELKQRIDTFKRESMTRLEDLRVKLGLTDISSLDAILKTKGNQKELQSVKEHREAIEKIENFSRANKDIEKKIEVI